MPWMKIDLPFSISKPVLALGADIKNSVCFAYKKTAFISEVVNDLEVLDSFNKFRARISLVPRRFSRQPKVVAYDKHPEYISTKYVQKLTAKRPSGLGLVAVSHHHAHIASCMIENNLSNQKVIGVAFDGTGFGDDSSLWGAEFLVADYQGFHRAAHLRYIPLLGGQKAILQPWRVTAAWLYLAYGEGFLEFDFLKRINKKQWRVLLKMWEQNFNAPLASSIGRLFDAAAGVVLGISKVKFEAEAAIKLEQLASRYEPKPEGYPFKIIRKKGVFVIDPVSIFKGIVNDLNNGYSREKIAAGFHMTVAQMIARVCLKIRDNTKINAIVLAGGVFQNKFLFKLSLDLLNKQGFQVFAHRLLPCSDASISLGQAVVASFKSALDN